MEPNKDQSGRMVAWIGVLLIAIAAAIAVNACTTKRTHHHAAAMPVVSDELCPEDGCAWCDEDSEAAFLLGAKTLCKADHGNGPDKWLFIHDGLKHNVCFLDGCCFYGC